MGIAGNAHLVKTLYGQKLGGVERLGGCGVMAVLILLEVF